MSEYRAPGAQVEEASFRAKLIEGLSTTTTAFVGPTRYGPVDLPLDVVTSIGEFERTYGDRQQLQFEDSPDTHNYMWHAARAFFENGGTRLYISRVFTPMKSPSSKHQSDGRARATIKHSSPMRETVEVAARFPGAAGNMRLRVAMRLGENVLGQNCGPSPDQIIPRAPHGLVENDVVVLRLHASPLTDSSTAVFATAHPFYDTSRGQQTWRFSTGSGSDLLLSDTHPDANRWVIDQVQVVTATVTVYPVDDTHLSPMMYSGLALHPHHKLNGRSDSIEAQFSETTASLCAASALPITIKVSGPEDGLTVLDALFQGGAVLRTKLLDPESTDADCSFDILLDGGNDGKRPGPEAFEGSVDAVLMKKKGLMSFEEVDEIAIVAAPGSTFGYEGPFRDGASSILNLLISHASRMRYRIAVLDSGDNQSIADVRALRAKLDSTHAALYYPWITILDPVTRQEIQLPPSGFVAGIYARNYVTRAA
jgi:hypothetical protein